MSQRQIAWAIGTAHLGGPLVGIVAAYAEVSEVERLELLVNQLIETKEAIILTSEPANEEYTIAFVHPAPHSSWSGRALWIDIQIHGPHGWIFGGGCNSSMSWTEPSIFHYGVKQGCVTSSIRGGPPPVRFRQTIEAILLARIDASHDAKSIS